MKDERKIRTNKQKASYDERMKAQGLIKSCYWISPDDTAAFSRKAEISREKHIKRQK